MWGGPGLGRSGVWSLGSGVWGLGSGVWSVGSGVWSGVRGCGGVCFSFFRFFLPASLSIPLGSVVFQCAARESGGCISFSGPGWVWFGPFLLLPFFPFFPPDFTLHSFSLSLGLESGVWAVCEEGRGRREEGEEGGEGRRERGWGGRGGRGEEGEGRGGRGEGERRETK